MISFRSLGRWRPEALLVAADGLEGGFAVPHFGHLYDVPMVVDALRRAAVQVEVARTRAIDTADRIFAHGWRFTTIGNEVVIQEMAASVVTYEELDRIEVLMGIYGATMAVALTDVEIALDELYAVLEAARRHPNARARPRVQRPLRTSSTGRACRDRRRDRWPCGWDR
ncbi:hypothetical protein ACIA03_08480 [Nocardioides sp. NPDC051685]|uniref:hypothetical protein n=1 Tax=Nocardioides sp. NPDC051685 TaxID=3364334 RepID=UPI0037B215ED